MNLLESVLRTADSIEYHGSFRKHNIDAFTLKILNEEDLLTLGVEDEVKRKTLLQHAANLHISAEELSDLKMTPQYMHIVFSNMSVQLTKHLACLSIALNRRDVIICDVRLGPSSTCLQNCVHSLEAQLNAFDAKVIKKKKKQQSKHKSIIISTISIASALVILYKLFS